MITVWGGQTSRSIRVVWVLEEMGLPYEIRQVDMLAPVQDPAFLAVNPANYIPAIQDGGVTMIESVAIMEYLMGRYGPTPLAPAPGDPAFAAYQQFLHLGEAGLATLMMPVVVSRFLAPEAERENWGATWARECVERRLDLVRARLARAPYMAGEAFTAADISVTYALNLGGKHAGFALGDAEQAYIARTTARDAFKRAMERSHEGLAPA
ncbi:glutathione S-transferase family protein [Phenylobacterium sp.]|uniref:glutathione S-transferase family protein n=1 Tax=Phenylobacterium sp. TaxID=1871053 RepID=UPI0025EFB5A7|nr:glutathione S-transferase family protein [Phenylobacterium sp.]MBX3486121.1 glutathione S-transferase family protein [Phenylobacterium sp.]MCW5759675.1 glutathione S-transferase family protein [Phenylobacterium sp.]